MSHDARHHRITRTVLRIAGPLLLLSGAASVAMGFTGTGLAAGDDDLTYSSIEWTDEDGTPVELPDDYTGGFGPQIELDEPHFGFIIGGGLTAMAGLLTSTLGWGGALSRYQVNESLPALRDVRRGLGANQALAAGAARPQLQTPVAASEPGAPFCRECGAQAKDTLQVFCGACGRGLE